jgi:hypothetical protein
MPRISAFSHSAPHLPLPSVPWGLKPVQRGLPFNRPSGPFTWITKEQQDIWEATLPRKVFAFLMYAKRRIWLKGHTFFRFRIAAEHFGVSIRTVQRWMKVLLEAGITRRIKRTGRGDWFVLVENSAEKSVENSAENLGPPPKKDVSDQTKMSCRIRSTYSEGRTNTDSRACGNVENSGGGPPEKEAADAATLTKNIPEKAERARERPPNIREQIEERRKRSREEVLAELGIDIRPHQSGMWRPISLKKPPE